MQPSDLRLLTGIRDALQSAIAAGATTDALATVAAAKIGIDELLLRTDDAFFESYYAQGRELAAAGAPLMRAASARAVVKEAVAALPQTLAAARAGDRTVRLDALKAALTRIVLEVNAYGDQDGEAGAFLKRVVDWENLLYSRRQKPPASTAPPQGTAGTQFTAEAIEKYLNARAPEWRGAKVSGLRRLAGGFSKTTVLFDVDAGGRKTSLVIKAEQPMTLVFLDSAAIENEFAVLRLTHAAGVRVAEPLWLETDTSHFACKFLVTAKAPGRNIGSAVSVNEDISPALLDDLIANLCKIHQTPVRRDDPNVRQSHLARWSQYRTISENTRATIDYWRESVESLKLPPSPLLTRALTWLATHVPECTDAPTFIHRDYGLHNILVQGNAVSCILDWECGTIGDPAEDLAWTATCLRGTIERDRVLQLYAQMSGNAIPEQRIRFFDVLNSLKFAVTCTHALSLFEQYPSAPISALHLGFLHMYHGTGDLNRAIESVA